MKTLSGIIMMLSDMHKGDGSNADDSLKRKGEPRITPMKLYKTIRKFIKHYKPKLVLLLGDMYELWQFSAEAIRQTHYLLIKYFESKLFKRVKGNHDYRLFAPLVYKFKTKSGLKVYACHAFHNDNFMKTPFARFCVWAITWLERKIPGIDNGISFKRDRNKSRIARKWDELAEYVLYKLDFDIFIGGHRHGDAFIRRMRDGKIYANTGFCSGTYLQAVLLNADTDKLKLIRRCYS